jgi:hypothetical protein
VFTYGAAPTFFRFLAVGANPLALILDRQDLGLLHVFVHFGVDDNGVLGFHLHVRLVGVVGVALVVVLLPSFILGLIILIQIGRNLLELLNPIHAFLGSLLLRHEFLLLFNGFECLDLFISIFLLLIIPLSPQLILILQVWIHSVLDALAMALFFTFEQSLGVKILRPVDHLVNFLHALFHRVPIMVRFQNVALDSGDELCQRWVLALVVHISGGHLEIAVLKLELGWFVFV